MKKGRRDRSCPPFVALSKDLLLKRHEFWDLSPAARDLYLLLKSRYTGANNGTIRLYYSEIKKLKISGLRGDKVISRAFFELEAEGWILRTKIGGLHRFINEYRLSGKHDQLFL